MNQQAQTPLSNLGKQKGTGRPTSGVDPSLSEIDPDPNTTEMAIRCRLLGFCQGLEVPDTPELAPGPPGGVGLRMGGRWYGPIP